MISVCGVSTILAYFNGLMIAISGFVVGDSAPRAHAWAHVLAVVLTDGGMPNRSNVPRAMLVMVHIAADYRGPRELPCFWGFDAEDTSRDFWHDATLRTSQRRCVQSTNLWLRSNLCLSRLVVAPPSERSLPSLLSLPPHLPRTQLVFVSNLLERRRQLQAPRPHAIRSQRRLP
eukprot:COSAG02_NODE_67_length_42609_cov_14.506681_15_plen_174_part_00